MEETHRDPAAVRHEGDHQPAHGQKVDETQTSGLSKARDFSHPPKIMTICAWCPVLNVLKVDRRYTDVLVIVVTKAKPMSVDAWLNGEKMLVSHGMCERHKAEQLAKVKL